VRKINIKTANEIKISWTKVPPNENNRYFNRSFLTPDTEKRFLNLLGMLGLMFGGQIQTHKILHYAPKTTRKILGMMKENGKVVEHTMTITGKAYKIYTLGPTGAEILNIPYRQNWVDYSDSEAIQKLMAVDLYVRMCDYLSTTLSVEEALKPYIHTFVHGDKSYKIGVLWDNAMAFIETYRWEPPRERVIIICQSLSQVSGLTQYLEENSPIRVITREKLREGLIFYRLDANSKRWVLDIPDNDKQIKEKANLQIVHKRKALLS
jgi:hypothetical protein